MAITKQDALRRIEENSALLYGLSDTVWDHPETAFQEYVSAKALCDTLTELGFSVKKGIAGIDTAFSASFGRGRPIIGLLAEFDALSGLSQKSGVATKSPLVADGAGHGCGHNLLGVGAIAAALGIKKYLEGDNREGTVIVFGCPGEEGGSGKSFMARDGVFDDIDFALTWHPGDFNLASVDSSLANTQIKYRFSGISSHASASPEMGRSALDAAELMNVGVQFLREHVRPNVRIHYAFTNAGGFSPNVVQSYSELLYLIRAPNNQEVEEIHRRVTAIAAGAALMTETKMEEIFVKACSNIVPNRTLCEVLRKNLGETPLPRFDDADQAFAKEIIDSFETRDEGLKPFVRRYSKKEDRRLLEEHASDALLNFILPILEGEETMTASSDVGDVSWVCPTAQISATTMAAGTPGHSWQLVAQGKSPIAHKGMLFAGKVIAGAAIDVLDDPRILQSAKREHRERVGEKPFSSPIPKDVRPTAIGSDN